MPARRIGPLMLQFEANPVNETSQHVTTEVGDIAALV
jgi:hypothetical protein